MHVNLTISYETRSRFVNIYRYLFKLPLYSFSDLFGLLPECLNLNQKKPRSMKCYLILLIYKSKSRTEYFIILFQCFRFELFELFNC